MYPHKPLAERIVRAKSKPLSIPTTKSIRGPYRYEWNDESMSNAMYAYEKGESVRRAAAMYGVPKSTLHDHVSGKILVGAKSGRDPYLTVEEEEELASFLVQTARIGYPHTRKQVFALVQQILDGKGIQTTITNGWWERFRQRHPNLTLRSAVSLSYARAMASDSDVLLRYYDMLEECLRSNKIYDVPHRIYNCDETGLPLNPKCLKVVDAVGSKNPSYLTGGDKSQVTVLACATACGQAIPPFVVFDRKSLNKKWTEGEVPGTLYGLSSNGWMTSDLFYYWFQCHFLEYIPPARPVLLLLDGHSSHYCPETIKLAAENKVIVFALPPHTTHITQPLDRGCFSPLKVAWREECHTFTTKHPGRVVTRVEFCEIFSKSWHKAVSPPNIIASFKATGICPFNRAVINPEDDKFSSFHPENLAERTGLAYIPLYSPSRCTRPLSELSSTSTTPQSLSPTPSSLSTSEKNSTAPARASLRHATSIYISNFLIPNIPPNELPTKHTKSAGKVLTSMENLQLIEERQKKKQEEAQKKEERKRKREERARLKQEQKIASKNKKKVGSTKKTVHWSDSAHDNDDYLVDTPFLYDSTESSDVLTDLKRKESSEYRKEPPPRSTGKSRQPDKINGSPCRKAPPHRLTGRSRQPGTVNGRPDPPQRSTRKSSQPGTVNGRPCRKEPPRRSTRRITQTETSELTRDDQHQNSTQLLTTKQKTAQPPSGMLLHENNSHQKDLPLGKQGVTRLSVDLGVGLSSSSQNSKKVPTLRSSKRKGRSPAGATVVSGDPGLSPNKEDPPRPLTRSRGKLGDDSEILQVNKEKCPQRSTRRREISKYRDHQINEADSLGPQTLTAKDERQNPHCGVSRRKGKQVLVTSEPIVVSDNDPDPDINWWIQDLFLNQRDREVLQTGKELTDNVVNAAQTLLSEQYPGLKGFQSTCLGHHLDFKPISREIPSVQVLHTGSSEHWLCVSCCGDGVIQVMDSLGSFMTLNLATVLQICKIYSAPPNHTTLKLRKLPVQQQNGTLDCGLFAVAYAVEVCAGNSPADVSFNQKQMRSHLYTCLSDGVMSPFPKMSRAREFLPRPTDRSLNMRMQATRGV